MLTGNEHYIVIKLVTGEQIMAILDAEDSNSIHVSYPMLMRTFPVVRDGKAQESLTATPYTQFADDANLYLEKRHIVYIKNLHHLLISHYVRIVEENASTVLVNRHEDGSVKRAEDLQWEEEMQNEADLLTDEEIRKRIAMLRSIFGSEEEEEPAVDGKNLIEGNDTIH